MPFNIKDIFKDNSGRGHFDSEALNENFLQYYQRLYLKQKQPSAWVLGNCHFENVIIIIFFLKRHPWQSWLLVKLQAAGLRLYLQRSSHQRPDACNFIKKQTLAQVFSCEFYEICKNTFFTEHLWAIASACSRLDHGYFHENVPTF